MYYLSTKKVAYRCRTLRYAQDFLYQCVKCDFSVWRSAYWDNGRFCYVLECDNYGRVHLRYSSMRFFENSGYEIVDYTPDYTVISALCVFAPGGAK